MDRVQATRTLAELAERKVRREKARFYHSLERYNAARGALAGQVRRDAGMVPQYVWRNAPNAYEAAMWRQWGVEGFGNRSARKAAARLVRK